MAKNETKEKFDALSENPNASKKRMLKKVGVWCAAGVLVAGIALGTGFGIGCNATYTVTLNSDTENAQLTGAGKYKKGKEVTISAKDMAGYKFDHWEYKGNKVSDKTQYTFKLTKDTKGEYKAVYTETINLVPSPDNNKVSVDPSQIPNGTMITLTAEDRVGYTFKCWKLNGVEVSNQQSYTFTMSTDTAGEYTAEYTINSYTVSVTSGLESAVLTGANTYEYNSTVTVTASDVTGYLFDHWDLDGNNVSSEKSYTFTLSKANNYTLKAVYVNAYNITLTSNIPHATLTVSGEYKVGEKVTISASDVEGYTFNHWELGGAQVSTDKTYTFTMSDTTKGEYKAVYDINTYTVTTTSDTAGATLKGAGTYNYNAEVTLTAEDVEGYTFSHWEYNNTNVSNDKSYTFTMLESTKGEYVAVYTINSYEVTLTSNLPSGVGTDTTLTGAGSFDYNTQVTITASDVTGYTFKRWTLNGEEVSTDKSYTFTMSDTTKGEYKAVYDINTYTVTTTSDTAGATLTGAGTYNYNAEVTLTAEDVEGYVFSYWEYNGTNVSSNKSYTFTMSESTEGTYKAVYVEAIELTINADGIDNKYMVGKGSTLENALSTILDENSTQMYSLLNTCGFYTNSDLLEVIDASIVLNNATTIYTKMATLDKITITDNVVKAKDTKISGNVVLPYMANESQVIKLGDNAFENCTLITDVTFPVCVTEIPRYAFNGCSSFTSIDIPEHITSIGFRSFYRCSKVTSVTLPNTLTEIGNGAFENCAKLPSIVFPNSTTLGGYVLQGCSSLTSVTLPNTMPALYANFFQDCKLLTTVTLPDTITSLNNDAFHGCAALTSVNIPEGVTSIGIDTFANCKSLTEIQLPSTLTTIRARAFDSCIKLTSIVVPEGVTTMELQAFTNCTSLVSITLPSTISSIGKSTFYNCYNLTDVIIAPNGVTNICEEAFNGCTKLSSITIPEGVTNIEQNAFLGCTGLTSITLPDSLLSIESYIFQRCTSLTSVVIPKNVKSIGRNIFSGCTSLTSVTFADTTGWYCAAKSTDTSGTDMDVTDATQNATKFKSAAYKSKFWLKKESTETTETV